MDRRRPALSSVRLLFVIALAAPVALVVHGIIAHDWGLLIAGVAMIAAIAGLFAYRQRQARHPAGLDVTG